MEEHLARWAVEQERLAEATEQHYEQFWAEMKHRLNGATNGDGHK
jgi:hypothetical protein